MKTVQRQSNILWVSGFIFWKNFSWGRSKTQQQIFLTWFQSSKLIFLMEVKNTKDYQELQDFLLKLKEKNMIFFQNCLMKSSLQMNQKQITYRWIKNRLLPSWWKEGWIVPLCSSHIWSNFWGFIHSSWIWNLHKSTCECFVQLWH